MKLIRQTAAPQPLVQRYGGNRFHVAGETYTGSIIVSPTGVIPWTVASVNALSMDSLAPLLPLAGSIDVCLLGCGARMQPLPLTLRAALKDAGLAVDPMDTGAACRTYNVLVGEGRAVAAALIAV